MIKSFLAHFIKATLIILVINLMQFVNAAEIKVNSLGDGYQSIYGTQGDDHIRAASSGPVDANVELYGGNDIVEFDEGSQAVNVSLSYDDRAAKHISLGAGNDNFSNSGYLDYLYLDFGEGGGSINVNKVREFVVKNIKAPSDDITFVNFILEPVFESGEVHISNTKFWSSIHVPYDYDLETEPQRYFSINAYGGVDIDWFNVDEKRELLNATVNFLSGNNRIRLYALNEKNLEINIGNNSKESVIDLYGTLETNALFEEPISIIFPSVMKKEDLKINIDKNGIISFKSMNGISLELHSSVFNLASYIFGINKPLKLDFKFSDDEVISLKELLEEQSFEVIKHLEGSANLDLGFYLGHVTTGDGDDKVTGGCHVSTGAGHDSIDLTKTHYYSYACNIHPGVGNDTITLDSTYFLYNIDYISGKLTVNNTSDYRNSTAGKRSIRIQGDYNLSQTKFEIVNNSTLKVSFNIEDELFFPGFFDGNKGLETFDSIQYANGDVITSMALYQMFNRPEVDYSCTDNDDEVRAHPQTNSILYGGYGNDTLSGGIEIYGGEGNDNLWADENHINALLSGGKHNDTLYGSLEVKNIFLFNQGDGDDFIKRSCRESCGDTIRFGPGITLGDIVFSYVLRRTGGSSTSGGVITYDNDIVQLVSYPGGTVTIYDGHVDFIQLDGGEIYSLSKLFPEQVNLFGTEDNDDVSTSRTHQYPGKAFLYGEDGDDEFSDIYYANGGEGDDSIRIATISEGGAGADRIEVGKSSQIIYNLLDTCGRDNTRCNSSERLDYYSYQKSGPIQLNIQFGAGITQESLVINRQDVNGILLGYGDDDVIEASSDLSSRLFTEHVTYTFASGVTLNGVELYSLLYPNHQQKLTTDNDVYLEHIQGADHQVMMLEGDDRYLGGGGIVYPGPGNDTITAASKVVIRKGDDTNTIQGPYADGLLLEFPDVTESDIIHNRVALTTESYKSEHDRFYHINLIADFGHGDKTIIKDVVTCKTICEIADISLAIPGIGALSLMDIEQTRNDIMFAGLHQQFNYQYPLVLNEGKLFNFKTVNFSQDYTFSMAVDGTPFCEVGFDSRYVAANDSSNPLNCIFQVSELASGKHTLTAKYQFPGKMYEDTIEFIANPTVPVITGSRPVADAGSLKLANYPFDVVIDHNQAYASVDVKLNGALIHAGLDSGNKRFARPFDLPFVEGDNQLEFVIRNIIGQDSLIYNIDYKEIDLVPTNITATTSGDNELQNNEIRISWLPSLDPERYQGFHLFCSNSPFTEINESNLCSLDGLIVQNETVFSVKSSQLYYFRVAAVDRFGHLGTPSEMISASRDITRPKVKIQVIGENKDEIYGMIHLGPGIFTFIAEYDEEVVGADVLYYLSEWGDFEIPMAFDAGTNRYIGTYDTRSLMNAEHYIHYIYDEESYYSGYTRAKDLAGNSVDPLFEHRVHIDLVGPRAMPVNISPAAVDGIIHYIPGSSITIDWEFDEALSANSTPEFSYLLSGDNRVAAQINTVTSLGNNRYRTVFTLPDDAGATQAEVLTISYSAQDRWGNQTVNQAARETYVVSLHDIIPPRAPVFEAAEAELNSVLISWQFEDTDQDLHHFNLYLDSGTPVTLNKDQRSYFIAERQPGEAIPVRLTAVDRNGNESDGVSQSFSTLIPNPVIETAEPGHGKVVLSWSPVPHHGALRHYAIYVDTKPFSAISGRTPVAVMTGQILRYEVKDLENEQQYYFAVAAVNLAKESLENVSTISATPESDKTGPEIAEVRWNDHVFSSNVTIAKSGTWSLDATDKGGLSRLEVLLDGQPYAVDASIGDGLSIPFDPDAVTDGLHQVRFRVFDIYDNQTEIPYNFAVKLAVPEAPVLLDPKDSFKTGQKTLSVMVSAERADAVQVVMNGDPHGRWIELSADGKVALPVALEAGDNQLTVKAKNRAGESALSREVVVTLDVDIPPTPTRLLVMAKPGGEISLSWSSNVDPDRDGFIVYRSSTAFNEVTEGTRITPQPVKAMSYHDLPGQDGQYFYRVTAVSVTGIESMPSELVQVIADRESPTAKISYQAHGEFDAEHHVVGRGDLELEVEVSEPLLTAPFVSLSAQGALASVALRARSETTYVGSINLDDTWPAGSAQITFSARDRVGNRGFSVVEGDSVNIDPQGPDVVRFQSTPASPVKVDSAAMDIELLLTFNEALGTVQSPVLGYQLGSRPGGEAALVAVDEKVWQAVITLPDDAGAAGPELLTFSVTASDRLNNPSTWQSEAGQNVQVYQGDLPPLAAPLGLRAKAIEKGRVVLSWQPVYSSAGYQVYRLGADEAEPQPVARLGEDTELVDTPPGDGAYRYAVATIRRANDQEAVSERSEWVAVNADAEPPLAPLNLKAALTPLGIQLSWDTNAAEAGLSYDIYRHATSPITAVDTLSPVLAGITDTTVTDSQPSQMLPAYAVIARDAAGNRSELSETVYLNLSLLPVREVALVKAEGQYPELRWSHDSTTLAGFELLAGGEMAEVTLTDGLITDKHYIDTGYTGGERRYTLVAQDINGEQSLPRSVLLPDVEMVFAAGAVLKRNLFSKVHVEVLSHSAAALPNQRLVAELMGHTIQSRPFTLQPGLQSVEMVFAGYGDLPDIAEFSLSLQGHANVGETVTVTQPVSLPVEQGLVPTVLETRNVIRGGRGEFRYVITNPGDETLTMLTALNSGRQPSPDVRISLLDSEGNTLGSQGYQQVVGDGLVTLANQHTVVRIPPGQRYRSEWISFNVPASTPYDATLQMDIARFYAHYGEETELQLAGVVADKALQLVDTTYYGEIEAVTPAHSFGDVPITITGTAHERETDLPMPSASLALIISHQGFERRVELLTDEHGHFSYQYQPQDNESGLFELSVIHPELTERPNQSRFMIQGATVSPAQVMLRTVKTVAEPFPLTVSTGPGTVLSQIALIATTAVPDGVEVFVPDGLSVAAASQQTADIQVWVASDGPEQGELQFDVQAVVEGEEAPRTIGHIQVQFRAAEAHPELSVTPSMLEFGATLTGSDEANLTLENRGTETLYAVQVELVTADGFPAPDWLQNRSHSTFPQLQPGEQLTLNLGVFPQGAAATGSEEFLVRITAANHAPRHVPIFVSLVEEGFGGAQLKVSNIYTGTLDVQGKVIQGLEGAKITLRNEAAPDIEYQAETDGYGEALLTDVRAGSYQFWITKPAHQTYAGRMRVRPGLVSSESVFLDYETVKLDWSIKEVPLQDKYEIVLNVDFVTDVPAAVLVAEPAAVMVPELAPGEVFYGEIRLTNHGLIRANSVEFVLPPNNDYFQYELLSATLPEVIEAKQSVVIPYRITGLRPVSPDGTGTGGGCHPYTRCLQVNSSFSCAGGNQSSANTQSCFIQPRKCSGGGGSGGGIWGGGWSGGGLPAGDMTGTTSTSPLPMCRVDCPDGCDSANNGGGR